MGDNLKEKTVSALFWTAVDRFGQQIFQFVIGLILANKLFPEDYGLLGMAMIFSTLSSVLVESGFGQALIRKKDANETDFNTVFYFNVFASVFLYLVIFFAAPFIAQFFKEQQLTLICRVVSIAILFNALYLVPFIQKVKEMDFKSVAKVNIFSTVMSGTISVVLVFLHCGVWALIFQQVSFQFFRLIAYQYIVRWRPRMLFSFRVIRELWSFSINILGTSLLNVLFNNIYMFILGKYYKKTEAGYYNQANKLSETFNFTFQQIVLGSTYSMLCQIQDDAERFRRILSEITRKAAIVAIPVVMVLIVIAKPLIFVLIKEKWLPAAPYFQLLCLGALFTPFYLLNISALNAKGLSKQTFLIETVKKALILCSILACLPFGIVAMLVGYASACLIAYFISVVYIKKDLHQSIRNQVRSLGSGGIIGCSVAFAAFLLSVLISSHYVLLPLQLTVVTVLYVLIIKKFQPELYNQVLEFISQKMRVLRKNPA